jgi:hypothetical protein
MAESRHIIGRNDHKAGMAARSVISNAITEADTKFRAVRVHANLIGEYMSEMHGGEWMVDVDHNAGFVLIRPALRNKRERA